MARADYNDNNDLTTLGPGIYCFIFNLKKMKKLVLFFAVAFAMSFASCGNKAAESTEATDSVAVVEEVAVEVVDTVAADSVAVDSAAVVAE